MPAHSGLHGGPGPAEPAARVGGVRLRVRLRVRVQGLLTVVRIRGRRLPRLRVVRADGRLRVGTRGPLRVGPQGRWPVRLGI
ncbi:acetylornithine aminotransferase [Streptomyces lydicamycinicus]|uniref:Acetylornithine aminotransferase n=1 Tax=Streptomyces lydicamycinicus TaxID=1546107 RepID=A0A0P4R696_9ACTN|nr:hypothetical protein [Streptomyces lydicamycinicus]GAO08618.1 acetylornithine aminotransferase [Streptomyces lydicamycinicus]